MSGGDRPAMTTWMLGGQSSVYLHDDRLEIGTTDPMFTETLARIPYRDARLLVSWSATRRLHLWIGFPVLAVGALLLVLGLVGLVDGSDGDAAAFVLVLAAGALAVGGPLAWMGRPRAITKFRLEGVHAHVEGVLSGSRRKQDELLLEIERRIRARQSVSPVE